jgi:hypothetical protein
MTLQIISLKGTDTANILLKISFNLYHDLGIFTDGLDSQHNIVSGDGMSQTGMVG